MPSFRSSIEIRATPARTWSVMRDVERWHEWTKSIGSVKLLDAGELGVGKRARIAQPKFPPAVWRVTEWHEGRGFAWVSGGPGLRVTGRHSVVPTDSGACVELSLEYEGLFAGVFSFLTRAITERYVAMEAAGLKARSEGRS